MDTSRILTDDEFIEINLKVLNERKSRDERKANGKLIAVIVAFSCIFIAIYHVWNSSRKTALPIAGILVPASIMCLYGGWVVFLAKRDKKKRENYQKSLEEEARRHVMAKLEQGLLKRPRTDKSSTSSESTTSTVHIESEKLSKPLKPTDEVEDSVRKKHHHKHCHQKCKHKHHKNKSRSSTCRHHHHHCHHNNHHHNHKTKAKRREELLKEIKEGKLELPQKKKPLSRTFSL
ncbi:hypothetical protein ACFFRR_003341 [Megaselia abdita]